MSANAAHAPASHVALYKATLEQAALAGEAIMGRVLTEVRQSLAERASKTRNFVERDQLELTLKLLVGSARFLCEKYPQALRDEFSHMALVMRDERAADNPDSRMGLLTSVNFDS